MTDSRKPLERWRLLLGEPAAQALGGLSGEAQAMDATLQWLYGRDDGESSGERKGDLSESQLSVPDWINAVHSLFPREVIERLERDAVERYGIKEIVTNPEVLARIEPSVTLLRAVLRTRHLMNPEVLAMARTLVARVVEQLMAKLAREVRQAFSGSRDRRRRSSAKIASNFDFRMTLADNLHRWDPQRQRLFLEKPVFVSRTRRHCERWDIVLLVDQSGSMVDSVIHSAVMAACLWNLPGMTTHLIAFDTQVVDLTADVADPVELLMKVQLGGGTDIAQALAYCRQLVTRPRDTVLVLISDLFEGGNAELMRSRVAQLVRSGVTVLCLLALSDEGAPVHDHQAAADLTQLGATVMACTPDAFPEVLAAALERA